MSRCQHGQKMIKFCIYEKCNVKQSGGCQYCMKKYHCHLGSTNFINQQQIQGIIKFMTIKPGIKIKNQSFQQAIYNYFNVVKSQISTSLDAISRMILNRLNYPYVNSKGLLQTYKKVKHRQYKKISPLQLRQLYQLKQNITLEFLQEQEKKLYENQSQNTLKIVNQIQQVFQKFTNTIQKFDYSIENYDAFFNKILEIYEHIKQSRDKKHDQIYQKNTVKSMKQDTYRSLTKKTSDQVKGQVQQGSIIKNPHMIKGTSEKNKSKKISSNNQLRNRKVSFDTRCEDLVGAFSNYDAKERQISERKKKLFDMLEKQKDEPKSIKSTVQKKNTNTFFSEQQQSNEKIQKVNDTIEHGNLFDKLMQQGIDFTQIIRTVLPAAEQKPKLYQNVEQVKKKVIKIPVKKFNNEEIQSPLFRKKKSYNAKPFTIGVEIIPQKNQTQDKQDLKESEEKVLFGEKQANSIKLLMESIQKSQQKAIPLLQAAIKYAPNNLSAAQYLSYLYLETNKPKQCLDVCNSIIQTIEDSPQSTDISVHILNNKASALNLLGRFSQSISILQKYLESNKNDILYKNLGDSYFSLGIYEKAVINYDQSLLLNSKNDETHYNLAVCLFVQQNFHNSKLQIQKALKLSPKNAPYTQLRQHVANRLQQIESCN